MNKSQKKRILLAEDDDSMRRFVEIILKKAGYEVLAAEDGLAAMQVALETEIDALVSDAIMPNLSGYDLCRMIRGNDEEKKIPCIILSGRVSESDDETRKIADTFLVKDTNLKENLTSALENLL
ncbi:MAG TPA: response regulator [Pyrinomonadaceae bacterium]|nr:response regulator [Pyrinomonadaceae bacterium]